MKLASANKSRRTQRPRPGEQASLRIILLALVSFFLGVGATAFWFHLAATRNASQSSFQAAGQPAETPAKAPLPVPPASPIPPAVSPDAIEAVKQAIPNAASVSLEDGEKTLRSAALKEFTAAANEMETQVKTAQQELLQAENGQSAADQQAAMKHLQQTQAAATEKLQQIAAKLHGQIAAWEQLKAESH